jgi:hypothetical protein
MMDDRFDHLADLSKTDLMRVVVALATETYALQDRLAVLERLLARQGLDLSELDAPAEPAAFDEERRAQVAAFTERVFGRLAADTD